MMNTSRKNHAPLQLEALEERMMLSSVEIFAAGQTGDESFNLLIDGNVVQTFENVGGNFEQREFEQFVFDSGESISADRVEIQFVNDDFDPATGRDNNLFVDGIVIDGNGFETEADTTFHTGIFADDGITGPGFLQTEVLNVNGTVSFLSDGTSTPVVTGPPVVTDPSVVASSTGTRIRVDATGETGEENLQLQIDGEAVADFSFDAAGQEQVFLFQTDEIVDISRVRIVFNNDSISPETGLDRNLLVRQFQTIDLESGDRAIFNTTDGRVFASSSFTELDGEVAGFGRGGILTSDAFLEVRETKTRIRVDAQGQTGEEILQIVFNDEVIGQFQATTERGAFFVESQVPVALEDLQIRFVNDDFDAATGRDRNLTVFNFQTIDLASGERAIAGTLENNVFSSGAFAEGEGIVEGFGRGNTLATNGFFSFRPAAV